MHNNNTTLKQKIYSEVTGYMSGGLSFSGHWSLDNVADDYIEYGKNKAKKIALLQETALKINERGITDNEARQIINAIENKKKYRTCKGIFDSIGESRLNYFDA